MNALKKISALYYRELTKLYGKTGFTLLIRFMKGKYSRVNLDAAGKAIAKAMKNKSGCCVGGSRHGRTILVPDDRASGSRRPVVLDLHETPSAMGDPASGVVSQRRYRSSMWWVYCMLLNLVVTLGFMVKWGTLIDSFYDAADISCQKDIAWSRDDSAEIVWLCLWSW